MTVADWILLVQFICIIVVFAYAAAHHPAVRRAARDLLPGWDDEDLQSAMRKVRHHAESWEFSNRELQALKATGLWPRN
jgi:hypothetical protein